MAWPKSSFGFFSYIVWKNLKELMEDPAKVNEILDLIDALNDYLKKKDNPQNPVDDNTNTNNKGGEETKKNRIQQFYEEAMDALKQVFSTDLSRELEKAAEAGKETAEKVTDAGKDILETVAEGAADLFNKAKDTGKDAVENALEEAKDLFNKAKDNGKDTLENAAEEARELFSKAEETVTKGLEEKLPEATEKLNQLADSVSDAVESLKDGTVKDQLDSLVENVSDKMKNLTDELSDKMEDPTDNPAQELYDNLVDKVMDTIEILKDDSVEGKLQELKDNVGKVMDELDQSFGKGTGNALDQINKLADEARELMDSMEFTMAKYAVSGLADQFREEGFSKGVEATSNLIQLLIQMNNQ